ncbi:MAG: hypothetical protein ABJB12_08500 [Pseudomonadota bacterium]
MKFCLTLAAVALLGAVTLEAHAQQPWLADRRYGEGIGVRVGNLELHPGISAELGYDSNYFLRAPSEDPLSAFRIRVTPAISLSTLGPQRRENGAPAPPSDVAFRAGAYVSYNELIATDSKHQSEMADQRHVDMGGDLMLTMFNTGRAGVDVYGNGVRTVQPSNDTNTEQAFNRDTVRGGGGITWRPGGGLFDWRLGGEVTYNYFEKSNFKFLNNYQPSANMRGRWRFLPRTAVLYDGTYTWIRYSNPSTQVDGSILTSRIGLNGLITSRLSALALVGWAGTFYDTPTTGQKPQQFDSLTAQAELKYFLGGEGTGAFNPGSVPVGLSYVAAGFTRDVQNSYLGSFYERDRGYLGVSYFLGGVYVITLTGGVANLRFPSYTVPSSTPGATGAAATNQDPFSEQRVDATLFTEYRLSNTFGVNGTVGYEQNITDVTIANDALKYSRWQVFLGARYFL